MIRRVVPTENVAASLIEISSSDIYVANLFVCCSEDPNLPADEQALPPKTGCAFSIALLGQGEDSPDGRWIYRKIPIQYGETFTISGLVIPAGSKVVVKSHGWSNIIYTATGSFV